MPSSECGLVCLLAAAGVRVRVYTAETRLACSFEPSEYMCLACVRWAVGVIPVCGACVESCSKKSREAEGGKDLVGHMS
jgi:hypothetical protein